MPPRSPRGDGSVGGASGVRLQQGGTWTCRASAVILATGGTAFLSRLLGANNNTADGHLMAAEAGARFSGMEFSCFYTVAAAHSTMTRAFPFMYGTYRDCEGNELSFKSFQAGLPMIARALVRGPVTVVLDQMPQRTRERLAHVQPNFLLPLLRKGIDPFKDQFPVTLRGEGTIRGTGGIALTDDECQAGVEGLYAAGDVASREPIVGAASGGGQPNSAWCVASGTWSGQAAARRAAADQTASGRAGAAGSSGTRTALTIDAGPHALTVGDIEAIRSTVSRDLNDIDKNMLRTGDGMRRSLAVLDDLWTQLAGQGTGAADRDALRAREAAALVAAGRWVLNSAIARQSDCQTCFMCELYCPADALYVGPDCERPESVDEEAILATDWPQQYRRDSGWGKNRDRHPNDVSFMQQMLPEALSIRAGQPDQAPPRPARDLPEACDTDIS